MRGISITLSGNGERISFSTSGFDNLILREGAQGFDGADLSYEETNLRGVDGAMRTEVVVGVREIFMPLEISRSSASEWRETASLLRRITNPFGADRGYISRGTTVTVESPWGVRTITGDRVISAGDMSWGAEQSLFEVGRQTIPLRLRCMDPWWHSDPVTQRWEAGEQPGFFDDGRTAGDPAIGWPFQLATSREINNNRDFSVEGDALAYPTWNIEGYTSYVEARNIARNRAWSINRTITRGQTVTVRTDPNRDGLAFEGPAGANWFNALNVYPDLWPLYPGSESVRVRMDSPDDAARVTMTYTPSWMGAL